MLRLVALLATAAHVQALKCVTIGDDQQAWCVAAGAFALSSTPTRMRELPRQQMASYKWRGHATSCPAFAAR